MDTTKLKRTGYLLLLLAVFVLLFLTITHYFYWWLLATIIGVGVLFLYERLKPKPKSSETITQ
jgi:hypothetical protein